MMVSTFERRALVLLAPLVGALFAACRAGLPPEPPGADVADAAAEIPPYQVQGNPYDTSAFAGEQPAQSAGHAGHEHMDHMNMNHGSTGGSEQAPPPAAPTGHEHMNHGAKADKPTAGSDAMPPDMHMPSEPKR